MSSKVSGSQPDILKFSILGKESIQCGFHLVPHIVSTILKETPSSTYAIITDKNIGSIFLDGFKKEFEQAFAALDESAPKPRILTRLVPPGETAKSRSVKAEVEDYLLSQKCTRDTVLIALGGGVIGDLTGFIAATFMRGIKYIQVPTTLLAMVDSSIGGKTAIDTKHGKNLIGAFWQPEFIFIDLAYLETLPQREFANGMAEVIKTAAIWDEDAFSILESQAPSIISAVTSGSTTKTFAGRLKSSRSEAQTLLLSVVTSSINVKSYIVTKDERETGLRNLVNFGHSIGHAIEAVLTPKMLHGECVAIGCILEAEIARQAGVLSQVAVGRLTRTLQAYGLPTSMKDSRITKLSESKELTTQKLLDVMAIDKKNKGNIKKIVLLDRIGHTFEQKASSVADDAIRRVLCETVRVITGVPTKSPVVMATPGSKSISNRALVLAALATGTCRLTNLLHSDDTAVMMSALANLKGAKFAWEDGGETLVVTGNGGILSAPAEGKELYLGNAGTAARFLTTVCALVRSSTPATTVVTGNARMKVRPIGPLVDSLVANGTEIEYLESTGCLPLRIGANGFHGGHIKLAASVSSQYVSSILLCAPYASEPIVLELIGGAVISQPYIDMTIAMMKTFGIEVVRDIGPNGEKLDVYRIPKGAYTNPAAYSVESDASSATYPLAIAAITGTTCTIPNIGTSSLQGDAGFAKLVLEPMGCTVEQTETSTTVTGPPIGQLRAIGNIDMETMTDAFLTASVLAAVATRSPVEGRAIANGPETALATRIHGIANQRVKECNRIQAMRDQLKKFGVETSEFDDGLIVHGTTIKSLAKRVSVYCYDDHRVAMAFSVLASVTLGTVIEERRCVEKTWPNWWDDLQTKIGIDVEGVDSHEASNSSPAGAVSKSRTINGAHPSDATVFIIGMRGAGKTWVGELASRATGLLYIDSDVYLEQMHKMTCGEFVKQHGWPAFRAEETRILEILMKEYSKGYIISLGGGILETPAARVALKAYGLERGPVVYIHRQIDEIFAFLELTNRPAYGESIYEVYKRRAPWFEDVSTHEYVNFTDVLQHPVTSLSPPVSTAGSRIEAQRFFNFILGHDLNRPESLLAPNRTSFLSLTFPDLNPFIMHIDEITSGVTAIELRVDLLSKAGKAVTTPTIPNRDYVHTQLAALRQRTHLPIVFSVRTHSQGGMFPDGAKKEYFDLLDLAVRSGCEYIDLEMGWPQEDIDAFASRKGYSHIIASWHNWSGDMKWDGDEVREKFALARKFDVAKLVGKANNMEDNHTLRKFVYDMSQESKTPLLAINMGVAGQLSRVLNTVFTPVTHPLLPAKAAPGQLTFAEVQKTLTLIGELPAKKFYIFGHPIGHSMSPVIHNTGFEVLGLPHHYNKYETKVVDDEVRRIIASPDFGGASVTIPLKLDIFPLLDKVSDHARAIGAVNTIIPVTLPDGSRELHGENTDWIAMRELCAEYLLKSVKITSETTGLILGAGGTCRAAVYALRALGLQTIYLFNRTRTSAEKIVAEFPKEYNIVIITSLETFPGPPPSAIIGTIPGEGTSLVRDEPGTIYIPESILASSTGGIVIDMAYKPYPTPLLALAQQKGGWAAIPGLSALLVQGYAQFTFWTGLRAPKTIIEREVWKRYLA